MDLGPDEVITKNHTDFTPRFGSRQRCQSTRQPDPREPTSSNTYDNNESNNDAVVSAPAQEPVVPYFQNPGGRGNVVPKYSKMNTINKFRRPGRRGGFGGGGRRFTREPKAMPSEEALAKLKVNLDELADELKRIRIEKSEDPVKTYLKEVMSDDTIKIYSPEDHGYKILRRERTEQEMLEIKRANHEMLEFAYCHQPQGRLDLTPMDVDLVDNLVNFVSKHGNMAFRTGACSLALDFDSFPPKLWRREAENTDMVLLRSVVVDGIAVQNAATNDFDRPFLYITRTSQLKADLPYSYDLNLSVKPLFDVIMAFLIRGHRVMVYLPKYYENYVTNGGISKVDDLVAFKKLKDLNFIEFREIIRDDRRGGIPQKRNWFKVMTEIADEQNAVFVSSDDYAPRGDNCQYKRPSERILTPCFLNTEDRLMVIQPTIRYRPDKNVKRFNVITAEEILIYPVSDREAYQEVLKSQLYLHEQIQLICELCQLYPMKSLHKVGIKQLLFLVARSEAPFETPSMTIADLFELRDLFPSD